MASLIKELNSAPLAGLMLVVALGFSLGRLRWRALSLGPAGGTLLVALGLGKLGLDFGQLYGTDSPVLTVGEFGFALFIYSVGFEAGPRFFSCLLGGPGWRFVLLGTVVNGIAVGLAIAFARLFGLSGSVAAGVFSGALTSAPSYAAAAEIAADPTALAVTFAVTYPIGLAGVVLLIDILPRMLRHDLTPEDEDVSGPGGRGGDHERTRAFLVREEEVAGRSLLELEIPKRTGCYVTRVHRGHEFFAPDRETRLLPGDQVMAKGRVDELAEFAKLVGPEVFDGELRSRMPPARRINVTASDVVGKTLAELSLTQRYRCLVTAIDRGGIVLEPSADLMVERNDVLSVAGARGAVRALERALGRFERSTGETDIAIYAGGIFLGLLIGRIHLGALGLDLALGTAGGLLLAGVVLGRFRKIGPFSAHVPIAARQLVRDLGILLFVAETGVKAGGSSFGVLGDAIWPALGAAVVVTTLSVVGGVVVGKNLLRMRAVDTWGSVAGGMTSSAALVAVRRAADSNEPALSYAAAYTMASVIVTMAGPVVIYLLA